MAAPLSLSLVRSPLTGPVMDGTVPVSGVAFAVNEAGSVNRNSQEMLKGLYDIAEMSIATYFKARQEGLPFIGIPVFTGRRFVHSGIHARPGAGIRSPADLAGKRVCLPQFWMTSSVWHRVFLSREYGIDAGQIEWVVTNPERLESAAYPAGVSVTLQQGRLPGQLLADGEVDAVLVPKRGGRLMAGAKFETPFEDVVAAQRDSYVRTGVFPIMHFVVMRGSLVAERPDLPARLYEAFAAAKAGALAAPGGLDGMEEPVWGETTAAALAMFDGDPWPYGLSANRPTLDLFQDCLIEQGLIAKPMPFDELFAPGHDTREAAE